MLHKISKKNAGIGIISMNVFTIFIFLLIIFKVIPYNSISGGRLDSYQAAYKTSIISIFTMSFGIPVIIIASELIKIEELKIFFKAWLVFALVLIAFLLYESAVVGIIIVGFGIPIIAVGAGLIKFEQSRIFFKVYLWLSFGIVCLNTIANLLGVTLFEKVIMALVTIIQAILFLRLAIDKDKTDNINLIEK